MIASLKAYIYPFYAWIICMSSLTLWSQNTAIPGHAHNDYYHDKPLIEALELGFTSIEVDVFPIDGKLYVAHDPPEDLSQYQTIEEMYLAPLKSYIDEHGKLYHTTDSRLFLMVDIKKDGAKAFEILRQLLVNYSEIIQHKFSQGWSNGPVRVVLSGNRPFDEVLQDTEMYMALDGRPEDLGKGYDSFQMPIISNHFKGVVQWNGKDPLTRHDFLPVKNLTEKAHAEGKQVRLWASPEDEQIWSYLLEAEVDFINTDQLERLRIFFDSQE